MKLHDAAVTVVTIVGELVVSGDSAGVIKIFDSTLKLLHWYESKKQYGHLVSVSFASNSPDKSLPNE